MAYNQMLARHHLGTQKKIVISDNIFVTEKNAVTGKLSVERALMLRFISSVTVALPSHLSSGSSGFVERVSFRDFTVKPHQTFPSGKKKSGSASKSRVV